MNEQVVKKDEGKVEVKTPRNKWIKLGVTLVFIVGFVIWGSFGWKMDPDKLERTATIVRVATQHVTYGYVIANKAELVPEEVDAVVKVVVEAMKESCDKLTAEEIKLTDLKSFVTDKVNKYIDDHFGGNTLYKTLVDGLLNTLFNSGEEYLNKEKVDAEDYLVIIKALEDGLEAGLADVKEITN